MVYQHYKCEKEGISLEEMFRLFSKNEGWAMVYQTKNALFYYLQTETSGISIVMTNLTNNHPVKHIRVEGKPEAVEEAKGLLEKKLNVKLVEAS